MKFKNLIKIFFNSINEMDMTPDNNETLDKEEVLFENKLFYDQYEVYINNSQLIDIFSKFIKENPSVSEEIIPKNFKPIGTSEFSIGIRELAFERLDILKKELSTHNLGEYNDIYYLSKFITYEIAIQALRELEKKVDLRKELYKDEDPFELFFDSYPCYFGYQKETLALSLYLYTLSHKIEYSTYSEFWSIVDEKHYNYTNKKDSLIRGNLQSKKIPYYYKEVEEYKKKDISQKYISNFVKEYYNESSALLIPDIEDGLIFGIRFAATGSNDREIIANSSYGLSGYLRKWEVSEEDFVSLCKNINKLATLLSNKDTYFSKIDSFRSEKMLIEFLKYELLIFNYHRKKKEFMIQKDELLTLSSFFKSYFDSLLVKVDIKQLVNLGFASYALFENNLYTEYDNLDDLYSTIEIYYEEYQEETFNHKMEEELDNNINFTSKINIEEFIDSISGVEFENLLEVLFNSLGYVVLQTKASGDQGADLILKKNNVTYTIQAKRYSSSVGNSAVQEAIAGKHYYDTDIAMVVTTNFFTPHAVSLAEKSNVILWDRDKLLSAIEISGM